MKVDLHFYRLAQCLIALFEVASWMLQLPVLLIEPTGDAATSELTVFYLILLDYALLYDFTYVSYARTNAEPVAQRERNALFHSKVFDGTDSQDLVCLFLRLVV